MNVGFYYHVEAVFEADGSARVPAYLGVFVQELARQAGKVTFYVHGRSPSGVEDFRLGDPLVRCVDIGPKRRFPERTFLPRPALRHYQPRSDGIDVMLVRGPTPLLPHFVRASRHVPVAVLLVGDYGDWVRRDTFPWWRNVLIWCWIQYYQRQQARAARNTLALVNSPRLANLVPHARRIEKVFTSSLTDQMLRAADRSVAEGWPASKGRELPVRLLYTGRILREKGLFDAVDCLRILEDRGYNTVLELVGWEDPRDPHIESLIERARGLGIKDRLMVTGYLPVGPELAEAYLRGDVYITPSYTDSFPRAVREAMAMGLPVVTTAVGGLADNLEDRVNALLIQPGSPEALAGAVQELIEDRDLRTRIATAATEWGRGFTNESSCATILDHLRAWIAEPETVTA